LNVPRNNVNFARLCALTFGTLLWLQLSSHALSAELSFEEPDARRIVVYLLPMFVLIITAVVRTHLGSLLLFPTSFGAVLVVMPRDITGAFGSVGSFLLAGLTLIAYSLAASTWFQQNGPAEYLETEREPDDNVEDRWAPYSGIFLPRGALLILLFIVMAAMIPLESTLVTRVARSFVIGPEPRSLEQGIIFCNLVMFFAWCVLAYAFFLVPALEMDIRIRHLEAKTEATLARAFTGRRLLVMGFCIVTAITLTVVLVLTRST
jgi:hypothetical protein